MSGQQGQGQEDKNSYGLLWGIALIFVASVLVWWKFSTELKYGFMKVKYWEMSAISFFVDDPEVQMRVALTNQAFEEGTIGQLTIHEASQMALVSGEYLRYPIGILLSLMAWFLYRGHGTMRFNKSYNMDALARQEKGNWPQISPVVDLDLVKEDINKGPWAVAQNPMQFSRKYKVLDVVIEADKKSSWKSEGVYTATLNKEKAAQVFAAQLGPLWTGAKQLPPHTRAMFATFLLRAEHKPDEARALLAKLSLSAAKGVLDCNEADEVIKKYGKNKIVQRCLERHAYVMTVMAELLEIARLDGVFATADFIWLKPVDRRLWYILNCVGRQVGACEIGGAFAHWLAEKQMGRALSVPMVDEAVKALDIAITNTIYVPDEEEQEKLEQK
jgi:intracellular multiplication protein IcmP